MKKTIIFLLFITVFLCSCANKIPFTYEMKNKPDLTHEDLKKLQFYLSHDLLLRKQTTVTREEKISDTETRIYQDRDVKEVIFEKGTKSVVKSVLEDDFLIMKVEDGRGNYLLFGNPGKSGNYYLIGDKALTGELYYGGELYRIVNYKLAFSKEPPLKQYSETEMREMLKRKRSSLDNVKPAQTVTYYPCLLVEESHFEKFLERLFGSDKNRRVVSGKKVEKKPEN